LAPKAESSVIHPVRVSINLAAGSSETASHHLRIMIQYNEDTENKQ